MANWERKALTFISQTSEWDKRGEVHSFISFAIALLRELTGAYMSLELEFQDSFTARVREATPSYLDDLIFNPGPLNQLLEKEGHRPVYWTQIPDKNAFEDLFQALSSAVILPIRTAGINALIALGWSELQSFEPSFREFVDVIRIRLGEIIRQTQIEHTFDTSISRYLALLHTLPEGMVFIGADGQSGWINTPAAILLQLGKPGEYPPAILSGAMSALVGRATNKEEISTMAAGLFSSPDSSLEHMLWHMEGKTLEVSCLPVTGKGKLWRFREIRDRG